jgi:DUF971 family protein
MSLIPTKIKLAAGDNTLAVHWSDGHESLYGYRYLRSKCPCATCEENTEVHDEPAGVLPILGQKPLHPERAELVGRYAVQLFWSDGHSSGIYAFSYLRSLCPCPECSALRETGGNNFPT